MNVEAPDQPNGQMESPPSPPRSPTFDLFPERPDVDMEPVHADWNPSNVPATQPDVNMAPAPGAPSAVDYTACPQSPLPDSMESEAQDAPEEDPPIVQEKKLYSRFYKLRCNMRRVFESNVFERLQFAVSLFSKDGTPAEERTMGLLVDCLTLSGSEDHLEKAAQFRERIRQVRLQSEGDTAQSSPKETLEEMIQTAPDDLDLITSSDVSKPVYTARPVVDSELTVQLKIVLEPTETFYLDCTEIVEEAYDFCDADALPTEVDRAVDKASEKAAAAAIKVLKEKVQHARDVRALMTEDAMDVEDGVPAVDRLQNLVHNPSGTFDLLVNREKSEAVYSETANSTVEFIEVELKMMLDVSSEIEEDIEEEGITRTASLKVPSFCRGTLRDRKIRKLKNIVAEEALSELDLIAQKVRVVASERMKNDLKAIFKFWKVLNKKNKYSETLARIKHIVNDPKMAGMYGARVQVYGSVSSGLALPESDLDINIALPLLKDLKTKKTILPEKNYDRACSQGVLSYLVRFFEREKMEGLFCVDTARVPVLSYKDPKTGHSVDITVSNPDGILQTKVLRHYLRDDVRVWQLVMVVKYWAKQRCVCGVPFGYINALGWTVMVIFFLQHCVQPPVAKLYHILHKDSEHVPRDVIVQHEKWEGSSMSGTNDTCIEELVVQFFDFYAHKFDFAKTRISLSDQVPVEEEESFMRSTPIFIEQPLIPGKNIVEYMESSKLQSTIKEMELAYYYARNIGKCDELLFIKKDRNMDLDD